ncbi:hypothetical protein HDU77_000247, partial [Chytriomyces hyalinus]
MDSKTLDYFIIADTGLRKSATNPMKNVIAETRRETLTGDPARGQTKARNRLMMINANGGLTLIFELSNEDGRWMVVRLGDTLVVSAYLAPSEGADTLTAFDSMMTRLQQQNIGSPIVLVGDFNARHSRVGDHSTVLNTVENGNRRSWIEKWLDDGDWLRVNPVQGKWTTWGSTGGKGITDLVFVNGPGIARVSNLTVLDNETAIGSDHHLLTFKVTGLAGFRKPPFKRINIRGLQGRMDKYREELKEREGLVNQVLTATIEEIEHHQLTGGPLSWEERVDIADRAWGFLWDWIRSAAKKVLGVVKFRGGALKADMIEDHLKELMS